MFEKVNPSHPDKVADRIAGAIVDLAYSREPNPRCAVEVLIGHGYAFIIIESNQTFTHDEVQPIIDRICGEGVIHTLRLLSIPQDEHLSYNQSGTPRCGDNGIFKGVPTSDEEMELSYMAWDIYEHIPKDGKYIRWREEKKSGDINHIIVCQSNLTEEVKNMLINRLSSSSIKLTINPLGEWTGGLDVDSGATNRKLGSDMGRAVTGGGLHGKDLSKADVSVNIVCYMMAQRTGMSVEACCAIGDKKVTFVFDNGDKITHDYPDVVEMAREYVKFIGGFEKLGEWGLV